MQEKMIRALQQKSAYDHSVENISLIETHISWIILTGQFAYKIKKAKDFGFYDAKRLEQRIEYSKEELRLNRRLAPELYLGISRIQGPKDKAKIMNEQLNGSIPKNDKLVDVAIKMHQFPNTQILFNKLKEEEIETKKIIDFSTKISTLHVNSAPIDLQNNFDNIKFIRDAAEKNLEVIEETNSSEYINSFIEQHRKWLKMEFTRLKPRFKKRLTNGSTRECHGDLHTQNIYLNNSQELIPFDAIDFNKNLRWIDPVSEISFLFMDLKVQKQNKFASVFINKWLEDTGDYSGLDLLPWYIAYRSLVRAKVICIKLEQINQNYKNKSISYNSIRELKSLLKKYINEAVYIEKGKSPGLILMHGLSGSGKSYLSKILTNRLMAIRIRSDIERKRLFGKLEFQKVNKCGILPLDSTTDYPLLIGDPYKQEVSAWLFNDWIPSLVKGCIKSKLPTIIDACFLKVSDRKPFIDLAKKEGIGISIISCECSDNIANERIEKRIRDNNDPSEAGNEIRKLQKQWIEPFNTFESSILIKYGENGSVDEVLEKLNTMIY